MDDVEDLRDEDSPTVKEMLAMDFTGPTRKCRRGSFRGWWAKERSSLSRFSCRSVANRGYAVNSRMLSHLTD